ncbi:hypothetical protein KJ761_00865 [Patescibacteria group bacterium]|nr:hypothetical protein [Patescibacteria group bacterium]
MDKKSPPKADQPRADKILWIVFFLLIVGSVAFTYYRVMIKKDYLISSEVDCDPYTEKCFIWNCDPESDVEGEACIGDPEMDIWYYKIVERNASRIPLCDPEVDEDCEPFLCEAGELECGETLCDAAAAAEGEECTDPEEYALNNPEEECDPEVDEDCEEEVCDPEIDEECPVEEIDNEAECDPEVDTECPVEEAAAVEEPTLEAGE